MKKKFFTIALLIAFSALTTTAMSPVMKGMDDAPPCTTTHTNWVLFTGPVSVLT